MQEDGFTVVLNHQGTVNLNKKPVPIETSLANKQKKTKYLDNFYKFQNQTKGENSSYFVNLILIFISQNIWEMKEIFKEWTQLFY